ncbi:glycosyltransferase [uncultured Amnibacterium sp.]|uniref:glycosyltransferase family 2 protein n=1 Tax=uncultured Amnibacterium sp. TaxID=1631851 RepID=UPI0035CC1ADD
MASHQLITAVVIVLLIAGISIPFWSLVGVGRAFRRHRPLALGVDGVPDRTDVAILIAAHNEESVIAATLRSATQQVDAGQIFIASDGSTDRTSAIARSFGANVLDVEPNRGKAGALAAAIDHFALAERFEVVMLLDADTKLAHDYMETGLPLFAAPDVIAVAGTAATNPKPKAPGLLAQVLVAYRERVYIVFQYLQKFGQAARYANVVPIVPGFASMYRSRVLSSIDITAKGLAIEDFNMTFEVHAKKLGRIEFRPGAALAYTQDPATFADYSKQVGRWSLGFWQTVKRHRFRPTRFWASLSVSIVELVIGCLSFLLVVPAVVISSIASFTVDSGIDPGFGAVVSEALPVPVLVTGALVPDFLITIVAAVIARRPLFLLLGLVFPLVRFVDAALCLHRLGVALFSRSSGVWVSPARRAIIEVLEEEALPVPAGSVVH